MLSVAIDDAQFGRFTEAKSRYQNAIEVIDSMADHIPTQGRREQLLATVLNNLAWLEATCADLSTRNPRDAVRHARRSTTLRPADGNSWNTLGAAHYRSGEFADAKAAFAKSMALRNNGDSFDWFFLSLLEHKLGNETEARRWYDQAVAWFKQSAPQHEELYRFQVEAAGELGLPKPDAPTIEAATAPVPFASRPASIKRMIRRKMSESAVKATQE
jgi:tetratricopeptide (TPR) repeat protein